MSESLSVELSPAYHDLDKVERAHADRHVGIVNTVQDRVEVSRDQVRVRRCNLDEGNECDVAD